MKIIKVSSSKGSYCSTEPDSVSRELEKKLEQSIKEKRNERIIVEIFDINDQSLILSSVVEQGRHLRRSL
ncbi:MAG: hypothetical protein ACM3S2_10290 [Ignavibacteriales bacterium]